MYGLRMVLNGPETIKKVDVGVRGRKEGTWMHRSRTCIGQFVGWLSADLTFEDSKMFFVRHGAEVAAPGNWDLRGNSVEAPGNQRMPGDVPVSWRQNGRT